MEKEINIFELLKKKSVYSRDDIINLEVLLSKNHFSILNFRNVEFFSPSASHELLKIIKKFKVKLINLDENLKLLLQTQNKLRKTNVDLNIYFELNSRLVLMQ